MDFRTTCPQAFADLIRPCWEADPKKQPTSQQIRLDAMMNNGKLSLMLLCEIGVCVWGGGVCGLYKHLFESLCRSYQTLLGSRPQETTYISAEFS